MKKGATKMGNRIGAWILILIMIVGLVAVPAGEVKAEANVPGTSVELKRIDSSSSGGYEEWTFSFTNNTDSDVAGVKIVILTNQEPTDPRTYGGNISVSYDSSIGGIVVYYPGTVKKGETLQNSDDRKIAYNRPENANMIKSYYVKEVNCVNTDNNLDLEVEYNYAKLLQYSLYFYDANMCGTDVDENCALNWRSDCHTQDASNGLDLTGGYHDAGDHVKFGLPQAYAAATLGIGYYEFKDAFTDLGQDKHMKTIMDRFVDYFIKCTKIGSDGNVSAFCYQVGDGDSDHDYWGKPENQEARNSYIYFTTPDHPCTDIVAETAAALAIYAVNYKDADPERATKALEYAKKLLYYAEHVGKMESSNQAPGLWSNKLNQYFYDGNTYEDDLALANIWVFKASGEEQYKTQYTQYMGNASTGWAQCWNEVWAAAFLAGGYNAQLKTLIDQNIRERSTDDGYVYVLEWGSARYNAALQLMALSYDKYAGTTYADWATGQMKYLLGDNKTKQNFVVGYNDNSPKHPHHRAASGYFSGSADANPTTPMANVLLGALVGGPDENGNYEDRANDYQRNEVAIDYNAGLVGAAAGLYLLHKNDADAKNGLATDEELSAIGVTDKYFGSGSGGSGSGGSGAGGSGSGGSGAGGSGSGGSGAGGSGSGGSGAGGSGSGGSGAGGSGSGGSGAGGSGSGGSGAGGSGSGTEGNGGSGNGGTGSTGNTKVQATSLTLTGSVTGAKNIPVGKTIKLAPKKKITLNVSFAPEDAEKESLTFTSSKPAIAKVDSKGKVTAGKKAGKATITIQSANGLKKTVTVQVMKKAVSKVKVKASKTTIKVKKTVKLKATLTPNKKNASDNVFWKSSNTKVATVSSKGVVKGVKKGKAKITAVATDGSGKKATVTIQVK